MGRELTGLGVVQHFGTLHAYEQALVALLAVGPFVVLFFVVHWRQSQERLERTTKQVVANDDESDAGTVPSDHSRLDGPV